jgi:SH3 domain-containing YSC84-like protein 1
MTNRRFAIAPALIAVGAMTFPIAMRAADSDAADRLKEAATVFQEVTAAPDKGIPEDLLSSAHCAVIVPGLKKGAFIVSAKFGKGFLTCRRAGNAGWSAPAAIRVEGGGVGFQIGASETDLVLLVMNDRGAQRLMSSEFTVGAEGEVAAGPVGRNSSAQTDGKFTAEILSWSRSRGVFAGVALQGATLREDKDENEALYGKKFTTKEIVNSSTAAPPAAARLMELLSAHSPREVRK